MAPTNVTRQTSTALALQGELARSAPQPKPLARASFGGPLQWALEGPGWTLLRPAIDFLLMWVALAIAFSGEGGLLHVRATSQPLLAMPALVIVLFYLRGLYRTRLRALVLDGVLPIVSAVSIAAMAVAMIGIYSNHAIPEHFVRTWLIAMACVAAGRALLALVQRSARARRLVSKPVLIMGAGVVGAQVARRLENHPEYGLVPVGFLDEDPRSVAEVGGRDVPVLGTVEDLDDAVASTGVGNLIVAFSSVETRASAVSSSAARSSASRCP